MQIDLNCDLGEGKGNDVAIMPYISSCNIACGGHYGNDATVAESINLAKLYKLKIGVHPSYPDKENFGRKSMSFSSENFKKIIAEQLKSFFIIAEKEGARVHHIKAHGALYNDLSVNRRLSKQYLNVLAPYKDSVNLYLPFKSCIADEAERQRFSVVYEAFSDRRYTNDLKLVSRASDHALICNVDDVIAQVLAIVEKENVPVISGGVQPIKAKTVCIHGDHPNVVPIVRKLNYKLKERAIVVK